MEHDIIGKPMISYIISYIYDIIYDIDYDLDYDIIIQTYDIIIHELPMIS